MNITNGVVSVEDGTKKSEEYSPARKVRVELSFAVPEGSDGAAVASEAGDAASAEVARLLGIPPSAKPAKVAKPVKAEPAKEPVKIGPSDKDKLAAAAGLPVDDGLGGATEPTKEPAKPAVVEDDLNDLLGLEAPKPVTNAELVDAAQKKNNAMKKIDPKWAPVKIRELCVKYAGADKHFRDIPVEKRAAFLKDLEALT